MKIRLLFIVCVSILIYSCLGQNKKTYPLIIIEDKYAQIRKLSNTVPPLNYKIKTLNGFIIDCSKYDFFFIKQLHNDKDVVGIINSKAGTFTIKLNLKGKTVFDSSTMIPFNKNNQPFSGFIQGDTVYLGVGVIAINNDSKQMMSYWSAKIEIK